MLVPVNAFAEAKEVISSNTIPDEMQPRTVINFIDDNHYMVETGGLVENKSEIILPDEIQEKVDIAKKDGSYYTAYQGKSPDPVEGLKVYYADDGFILRLEYPDGIDESEVKEIVSPNELLRAPGPNDTLLYQWGAHKNQIWRIGNSKTARFGYGRATNYPDTYGQQDHVLKKGDAATSQYYDNCAFGTELSVNGPKKGGGVAFVTLYKRDIGKLPDAVLDIWKTGVEYWGYTWSDSLSINDIQYTHS